MSSAYLAAVKARRTIYTLKNESTIDDKMIEKIISQAVLHTPSSFNSQSTRVIVLLKEEHKKLWKFAKDALKSVLSPEKYAATEQKLNNFQGAYGTVLFFVAKSVVKSLQDRFPLYANKFAAWASQSDGMAQHVAWTALEAEGLGANLQHFSPLIDADVQKTWDVPEDWELSSQLVFGTPTALAGEKIYSDLNDRLKVYGA